MNKLLKITLISVVFTLVVLLSLVFAKNTLDGYNKKIQEYAPQLSELQQQAMQDEADLNVIEAVTDEIDDLAQKALFFIYVIIPLMPFLAWIFLEGLIWKLIIHGNFNKFKKFLKDFSIISGAGFIIFYFLFYNMAKGDNYLFITKPQILINYLILFIMYYFMVLIFCALKKYRWREAIVQGVKLIKKSFLKVFGLYFALSIVKILYLVFFMFIYVQLLGSMASVDFAVINYFFLLGILITIVLGSYIKIKIFDVVKKHI